MPVSWASVRENGWIGNWQEADSSRVPPTRTGREADAERNGGRFAAPYCLQVDGSDRLRRGGPPFGVMIRASWAVAGGLAAAPLDSRSSAN